MYKKYKNDILLDGYKSCAVMHTVGSETLPMFGVFELGEGVAPEGVGLALSTERTKASTPSWLSNGA